MKNTALVLVSHGEMAKGTLKSAGMIVGEIEDAYAISLNQHEVIESFNKKFEEVIERIRNYKNVIVLVDIVGGTPCNVALTKLFNYSNVRVVSGFNLAMVLELAVSQEEDINVLIKNIIKCGKEQIKDLKEELMGVEV
jgi:mannose PTS system EIIA component